MDETNHDDTDVARWEAPEFVHPDSTVVQRRHTYPAAAAWTMGVQDVVGTALEALGHDRSSVVAVTVHVQERQPFPSV